MTTSHALPLTHEEDTGACRMDRRTPPFSWMSDFERRGVIHLFPLACPRQGRGDAPLVTKGADEIIATDRCHTVARSDAALVLDLNLRRLAQAPSVIDLKLGERLALLKEGSRLLRLGYVRLGDFCREELGISPRLASELIRASRDLEHFPLLKNAFLAGYINRSALRHIVPVVTADTEADWVRKAKTLTVREIEAEVQKAKSPAGSTGDGTDNTALFPAQGDDEGLGEVLSFQASLSLVWKWDTARELFHRLEGADCSPAAFVEALCAEYLSWPSPTVLASTDSVQVMEGTPVMENAPVTEGAPQDSSELLLSGISASDVQDDLQMPWKCSPDVQEDREKLRTQWKEVHQSLEELSNRWEFLSHDPVLVSVQVKEVEGQGFREIAQQCRELVALRQEVQFFIARLLRTVNQLSLYRDMMFSSLGHYAVERLGMSRRTAYELVCLGRRFIELPELGDAFRRGMLTQEQASLIAGIIDEKTVEAWIAYARKVPVLALQAETARIKRLMEMDENLPWKTLLLPGYTPECRNQEHSMQDTMAAAQALHGAYEVQAAPVQGGGGIPCPQRQVQLCAVEKQDAVMSPVRFSFFLSGDLKSLWNEALSRFLADTGRAFTAVEGAINEKMSDLFRQKATCGEITAQYLEALLDHFLSTWLTLTEKERHHRILVRDGFRCQVPGCSSRRNLQVHHIVFRSQGGSNEDNNLITACLSHHLHGIHAGHLTIEGEAPDRLTIKLGVESGREPFIVWQSGERITRRTS